MKKKSRFVLLLVVSLLVAKSYGQSDYYWSGGKKINLEIDSTRLILFFDSQASLKNVRDKVSSSGKIKSYKEVFVGRQESLEVKFLKENFRELRQEFLENPEASFVIPFYSFEKMPMYFTNEIILKTKSGIEISEILNLAREVTIKEKSQYDTYLLQVHKTQNLFKASNKIAESGLVEWCHPNFSTELVRNVIPTDPLFNQQYYLHNTGQLGGTSNIDINAPEAWDITRGCNVRIAVIDDGVEAHEDLVGRVLAGNTPRTGGNGAPNFNGAHGQACAGIIAATHNNVGVSGVAPNSLIIPINIFSGGETANDLANGINWAWNANQGNADIISNSWGYNTTQVMSDAIVQAITNARTLGRVRGGATLGCVVVLSSGNFQTQIPGVMFPANVANVITVGAINNSGTIWNYSNRGSEMDLVAPSGDVPTGNVTTTDRMNGNGYGPGNTTSSFGGTSAACPQVAGVAALMISLNPNLTEVNVRTILQQTAIDMGTSGFDNTHGFGRVNALAALNRVITDRGTAIVGNNLICNVETNTLTNGPPGNLTWSTSQPSGLSITAWGTAQRLSNYNGSANIIATLTTAQGCVSVITKPVWVGSPLITNQKVDGGPYSSGQMICPGNHWLSVTPVGTGALSATWTVPPGIPFFVGTNTLDFTFPTSSSSVAITTRSSNTCGAGPNSSFFLVKKTFGCGSFAITVYPNPVGDELVVDVSPVEKGEELQEAIIEQALLFDGSSGLAAEGAKGGKQSKLDVKSLPRANIIYT